MLALVIYFFVLAILLARQLYLAIKDKFADKQRNYLIAGMTIVLILTYFFPSGLIDFDKLEGDNLLVAQRKGVANCMTTLKLKDNNKFIQQSVCFGLTEITGTYEVKGDTITFDNISYGRGSNEFYKYAVVKNSKNNSDGYKGYLDLFKTQTDTIGIPLLIVKNTL